MPKEAKIDGSFLDTKAVNVLIRISSSLYVTYAGIFVQFVH